MFTWICPQCGKEVPPSSSECPSCAERRQQATHPPQPPQPPPPQPNYPPLPPQPQAPPQQPVYTIDNGGKKGMPAWLATLLTLIVIGGGLFLLYRYVGARNGASAAPAADAAPPQQPSASAGSHPYARYIEVVGVRLFESADKKPLVRFTVVNHSPAELSGLVLRITFTTAASAPGAEPVAVVDAKVGSIPANGIKDMESPLATHLRIYELPDWQFVRASVEITAPK